MNKRAKKRGQKLAKRWEGFSAQAKEASREHIQENFIRRLPNAKRVRLLILEWCLLIVIIVSLALTQAFWYRQSYATQAYVGGGTYTEATLGKVNSLNPLFAKTSSEKTLSKLMFATLSTIDYSGHVGLGVASSIVPDETSKVWTVKLRDGLKWSDGEPLTLDDVEFTMNLIKDPTVNSNYSSNFAGIKISRSDDALVFTLPSAYVDFDATLNVPILPKHILQDVSPSQLLESNFSVKPVTSGAFAFNAMQSVSTAGEKIIYLAANDNYYKGRPMLESFAIHTYETNDEIVKAMTTGEATATAELSATYRDQLPTELIYEKQTALASGVFAFFNTKSSILSQAVTRQAIRQGIDMAQVRSVLGYEFPIDYPILDTQITLKEVPTLPAYDFEASRAALAEMAGQSLRLVTIDSGYFPELAEEFKKQLEELGFKVELTVYAPSQEFLVEVIQTRNYDILLYEVELGADPDLFAYYHSSQTSANGRNLSEYSSYLVDDLIIGARISTNPELRKVKYQTFLDRWVKDVPAIGIYQTSLVYYFNKNVRNFSEDNRLVYATDRFNDVEYWAVNRAEKNRTP